jgi:hypothetical protein
MGTTDIVITEPLLNPNSPIVKTLCEAFLRA